MRSGCAVELAVTRIPVLGPDKVKFFAAIAIAPVDNVMVLHPVGVTLIVSPALVGLAAATAARKLPVPLSAQLVTGINAARAFKGERQNKVAKDNARGVWDRWRGTRGNNIG